MIQSLQQQLQPLLLILQVFLKVVSLERAWRLTMNLKDYSHQVMKDGKRLLTRYMRYLKILLLSKD